MLHIDRYGKEKGNFADVIPVDLEQYDDMKFYGITFEKKDIELIRQRSNNFVKVRSFNATNINDGIDTICDVLKTNDSITHLSLTGSNINEERATRLAQSLETNSTLQRLNLSCIFSIVCFLTCRQSYWKRRSRSIVQMVENKSIY